ncbi:MAG: DnaJ domain-containing protein [Candidatus Micrarchaeota archaeon]
MTTDNRFSGKKAVIADRIQTNMNYYGVFGLEPGAKPDEIRAAFFAAIREFNPASPLTENENMVAQVLIEAYHTLSDPAKRVKYDKRFGDIPARKEEMPTQTTNPMFWLYGDSKYKARANYELLTKGLERYKDSRVVDFITDKELGAACVWAITGFARGPPKTQAFKDAVSKTGVIATEAYYDDNMAILRKKLKDPDNRNIAIILAGIGGFAEVRIMAGEFVIEQGSIDDLVELAGRSSCSSETRLAAVQRLTATLSKDQLMAIDLVMIPAIIRLGSQEINLHTIIRDAIQGPPELPIAELTSTPILDKPADRLVPSALPRSKAPAILGQKSIVDMEAGVVNHELSFMQSQYAPARVATQDLKVEALSVADLFKIVQEKLPGRIRASHELIRRSDMAESTNQLLGLFAMFEGNDPISKSLRVDIEAKVRSLLDRQQTQNAGNPLAGKALKEFAGVSPSQKGARLLEPTGKGAAPRPDKLKR